MKKPRRKESKRPQIVEASPYDIPDVVMDLVSQICLAKDTREYREHIGLPLSQIVFGKFDSEKRLEKDGIYHYFYKKRNLFSEHDFFWKLVMALDNLYKEIVNNENNTQVRVVVAGIYDSGKSYFINTVFLGEEDFLPVSSERSTAISTAVHFSNNASGIQVKATNQKGVVVNLDERVLKILRHQSDGQMSFSGQVIMSVIKDLFIVKPSERFNGYIIIDTPGFNSGDEANSFNNRNDDQEALEALKNGDIMIWVHDVTLGNLDKKELHFISKFDGPYAVMLSKGNRSTPDTCESIMYECHDQLRTVLEEKIYKNLIDVFVYDYACEVGILPEEKQSITHSVNSHEGDKIEDILSRARMNISKSFNSYPSMTAIHKLFQNEIKTAEDRIKEIRNCNEKYLYDWEFYAHDMFKDEVKQKEDKSFALFYSSVNKVDDYSALDSNQKEWVKQETILKLIKDTVSQTKAKYDFYVKEQVELKEFVDRLSIIEHDLSEVVEIGVAKYKETIKEQNAFWKNNSNDNIFNAIDTGDDLNFRKCLSGVDLKSTNEEGFTPLTYAVRSGNNTMVRILLQYGADPCALDSRGRNAFHTAVEFQYRDICGILLGTQYANQLIDIKTQDNRDIWELLEVNNFKDWLKEEIDEINNHN